MMAPIVGIYVIEPAGDKNFSAFFRVGKYLTSMLDATMTILRQLNDPARYHTVSGVPIFRAHRFHRRDAEGNIRVLSATDADLYEIAEKARKRESHGHLIRLTIGHLKRDPMMPEHDQPILLGYAVNVRVGRFGPKKIKGVIADFKIDRRKTSIANGYPFRSAEYLIDEKEIRGVALLVQDPALDLGTVEMLSSEKSLVCYAMRGMILMPKKIAKPVKTVFYADDIPDADPVPDPNAEPAPEAMTDEETKMFAKFWAAIQPKLTELIDNIVKADDGRVADDDHDYALVADEGRQAATPKSKPDAKKPAAPTAYQRTLKAQNDRIEKLEREKDASDCRVMLIDLQREVTFDMEREILSLTALQPSDRADRIDYMRETYRPVEDAPVFAIYSGDMAGSDAINRPLTFAQMQSAQHYARVNKVDLPTAYEAIKKARK